MKSLSRALASFWLLVGICSAQFVPGVTTTTSMGTWFSYNIVNITNGAGLSSLTPQATHDNDWTHMWISNQITTGWILFDLGSVQPLGLIAVWNYNSSISLARGVALMNVLTSTDNVNFTPLSTEAPPQGTTQPLPPHLIAGNGVPARYVRFDVLQNYGDSYTGLAEVQFAAGSGATIGSNTVLGQGCIGAATSFYENFATAASFDLANSSLSMIALGGGNYIVVPGVSAFVPPSAAASTLSLTNDSQVAVTLAAPFPYATGSTTTLQVCSNGFVSVASGNGTGATPAVTTMLNAPQTAWWAWHDYDPAAVGGGAVKFEQNAGIAYITWSGVWDSGGSSAASASTMQFQFDTSSGTVHMLFQTMSGLGNGYLVGYSPGGTSANHGNTDLSAALPATIVLGTVDVLPLTLAGGTRPVINSNWTLNVTNVPATGTIGIDVYGATDPGIVDLGILGAPGCGARASLDVLNAWFVAGTTHSYTLALPNDPTFVSQHIFTQAVVLQPGVNSLLGGVITSNGIDGRIGNL